MKYLLVFVIVFLVGCKPGVVYKTSYRVPGIGTQVPGSAVTHFNILDHVLNADELVCYEAQEKLWIETTLKFTVDTLWVEYVEDNPGFTGGANKFKCE